MKIVSAQIELPGPRWSQAVLLQELESSWTGKVSDRERSLLARLAKSSGVLSKHLAMAPEEYRVQSDFTARNKVFLEAGQKLAVAVIARALRDAGIQGSDVDAIFFTTVTGIAVPSLDARVASQLGFREDIVRVPLFGLGCVGGAAGLARVHDYLRAWPGKIAVLLSVELCSLTLQLDDLSPESIVASTLFGDGATAVVCAGDKHTLATKKGLRSLATVSRLYPDSGHIMGWDVGSHGFKILLDPGVPQIIERYFADDTRNFLGAHGVSVDGISDWICHPGGPKVLRAIESSLALPADALKHSWEQLESMGNLSSSSVLAILKSTMDSVPAGSKDGKYALISAMGPGFCSELVLCQWN
jgi:alkylresorcinol/alkylpyrone synthase